MNYILIITVGGNLVFHFPSSNFHASVDINSQRGVEPRSLEISIGLESINLTVDLVQELFSRLKPRDSTRSPPPPSSQPSPFIPTTPSRFSSMSSNLQFMVGRRIPVNIYPILTLPQSLSRRSATRKDPKKTFLDVSSFSFVCGFPFDDPVRPCYLQSTS